MQTPLTLATLRPDLESTVSRLLASQITLLPHPHYGAVVSSDDGRPAPSATAGLVTAGAYLCLVHGTVDTALLGRLISAADALLGLQRPGGLVDRPTVNIDSGPDTGFIVQLLCTVLDLGRRATWVDDAWDRLLERVSRFVRRAGEERPHPADL
ncbi:MAG: hypothetical protein MUF84_15560 [Anaerolineae bacterium]|nr:hypothetical protein [Anaerolineae bacterium]